MDEYTNFRKIIAAREEDRKEAARQYNIQCKERLKRTMETKIRTTMIGALSAVEERFGKQWGQGKPRHALTGEEINMERVWEDLRTKILNNGNNQLRAALAEIDQYEISWNRFTYTLTPSNTENTEYTPRTEYTERTDSDE
jgi:hypothetical protein